MLSLLAELAWGSRPAHPRGQVLIIEKKKFHAVLDDFPAHQDVFWELASERRELLEQAYAAFGQRAIEGGRNSSSDTVWKQDRVRHTLYST